MMLTLLYWSIKVNNHYKRTSILVHKRTAILVPPHICCLIMASLNLIFVAIAVCLASLANAVAITGSQGGVNDVTGQRPSRQDITIFKDSGPAFDLYILSLQKLQQQNQSTLLSYYQVAGNGPLLVYDV